MEKKKQKSVEKKKKLREDPVLDLDDSLRPVEESDSEEPEIFMISKRSSSLDRKSFIKSAAAIGGLAALGSLMSGCEESELEIENDGKNCTCHAVCSCNTDTWEDDRKKNYEKGNTFGTRYDINKNCTCNTVCTCNSVCTCDSVCSCDTEGGGGGGGYYYTYWYPN
jgi:hypothetical protein